jgi:predicted nucleic acid-binding protein
VNFVLDTNAVSETRNTGPNSEFMAWLEAPEPAHLFITTITLGEAWLSLHRLPPNHSDYESIKRFITNLPRTYRVLNFDLRAAAIW